MIENQAGSGSAKGSYSIFHGIRNLGSRFSNWVKNADLITRVIGGLITAAIVAAIPFVIKILVKKSGPTLPPSTPKIIAAVGPYSRSSSQYAIWEDIYTGMQDAQAKLPAGYTLEPIEDKGDPDFSAQQANDICKKADQYLMVLGFVETNVAKQALPNYEYCSPNKVPVIIIAATSTDLTEANRRSGGYVMPLLRLPPSNYHQANMIVEALGDTFNTDPCKLLLIKDRDNDGYANDLETVFRHIREKARTKCDPTSKWFDELDLKSVWREKWDAIVLFGMKEKAIPLLDARAQVPPQTINNPVLIVSDGATTEETLQAAARAHFPIWGVFPASQPPKEKVAQARHYDRKPSYYPYGYDAIMIAAHAITDIQSRGEVPNRLTLQKEFTRIVSERGHFVDGLAGKYEFGSDGGLRFLLSDRTGWPDELLESYHFWYTDLSGNPQWLHRGSRSSLHCFTPDCASKHMSSLRKNSKMNIVQ
jgi:ABC-type branched-subunit amino acid transport system substrate-binding protein